MVFIAANLSGSSTWACVPGIRVALPPSLVASEQPHRAQTVETLSACPSGVENRCELLE